MSKHNQYLIILPHERIKTFLMKKDTETTVMHSNLIEGNTAWVHTFSGYCIKPESYESVSMFHAIVKVQNFCVSHSLSHY